MPKKEKVKVKERVEDNVCDLSLSELTEVPVRKIAAFKRVTTLDLSSNRLATLGKNFVTLTRLTKLDLSKNQIKHLPEDFGLLRNLRHLDLYDNKLEHLPLSFGNLNSLRYLDLKGNPLMPAIAKVVGHCLTTKDCQNAAKNTVKFLAHMQLEAEKAKQKYRLENPTQFQLDADDINGKMEKVVGEEDAQKSSKKNTKKSKPKQKKNAMEAQEVKLANGNKNAKMSRKSSNNNKSSTKNGSRSSSTALISILVFLLLLGVNIGLIYMITFKNPEIADKLAEYIPPQYRDWILTKTQFFRLRVSDWIQEFRTQPEEN